jgi:hypothetical protein
MTCGSSSSKSSPPGRSPAKTWTNAVPSAAVAANRKNSLSLSVRQGPPRAFGGQSAEDRIRHSLRAISCGRPHGCPVGVLRQIWGRQSSRYVAQPSKLVSTGVILVHGIAPSLHPPQIGNCSGDRNHYFSSIKFWRASEVGFYFWK